MGSGSRPLERVLKLFARPFPWSGGDDGSELVRREEDDEVKDSKERS